MADRAGDLPVPVSGGLRQGVAGSGPAAGAPRGRIGWGWLLRVHNRLNTYQKVLFANASLLAIGGVAGILLTRWTLQRQEPLLAFLPPFVALGLLASLALNAFLLRLAFRPLFQVQSSIERIRGGDFRHRVPAVQGDPQASRLAETLNHMLDRIESHHRQRAAEILEAVERDRKRIARELHDGPGQLLSALGIRLGILQGAGAGRPGGEPGGEWVREQARELQETLERAIEELRRVIFDLRPTLLDDLGLLPAIRWSAHRLLDGAGIPFTLEVDGFTERLPEPLETTLFRMVQECLTNAARHSSASAVRIELREKPDRLLLRVSDDGRGFQPTEGRRPGQGLGLLGLRERAALIGAELRVDAAPGRGAAIEIELPRGGNPV